MRVIKNVGWNLIGTGAPLLVAILTIPVILKGYGDARFALITLLWIIIGYFSIFDFGVGKALTKLVSERVGTNRSKEVPNIILAGFLIMLLLSIIISFIIYFYGSVGLEYLKISDESILIDVKKTIPILSIGIPFAVLSAAVIGILEAHSEFFYVNSVRLVSGVMNFMAPFVMQYWNTEIKNVVLILVLLKGIAFFIYFAKLFDKTINIKFKKARLDKISLKLILGYGVWSMVSNLSSSIMVQFDKFIVSAILPIQMLPIYSIPSDMVNRFSILPAAVTTVLFPKFSHTINNNKIEFSELLNASLKVLVWTLFVPTFILFLFAVEIFEVWLGSKFSFDAEMVVKILVIGFFINGIARIPYTIIHAAGRPDVAALIHLIELPVFGLLIWELISRYGINGAALAWTTRILIDFLLMISASIYVCKGAMQSYRSVILEFIAALILIGFAVAIDEFIFKLIYSIFAVFLAGLTLRRFKNRIMR